MIVQAKFNVAGSVNYRGGSKMVKIKVINGFELFQLKNGQR